MRTVRGKVGMSVPILLSVALAQSTAQAEVELDIGLQATMEVVTRDPELTVDFPRLGTREVETLESNDADVSGVAEMVAVPLVNTLFVGVRGTGRVAWDGEEEVGEAFARATAFGCLGIINNSPEDKIVEVKITIWESPLDIAGTVASVIRGLLDMADYEHAEAQAQVNIFPVGGDLNNVFFSIWDTNEPLFTEGFDLLAIPITVTEFMTVPGFEDPTVFEIHDVCFSAQVEGLGFSLFDGTEGRRLFVDRPIVSPPDLTFTAEELSASVVDFFDAAVAHDFLVGSGPGRSAEPRRRQVSRALERIHDHVTAGRETAACRLLDATAAHADGDASPPDFIEGPLRGELYDRLREVQETLACR